MAYVVTVQFKPLLVLADRQPLCIFRRGVYFFITLTEKQNIRRNFCSRGLFERGIRQPDRPDQFCSVGDILSDTCRLLVHRAFGGDNRHNAARFNLINALGDKVIMYLKTVSCIGAVIHRIVAERNVAHHNVKLIVGKSCLLKSFNLYVCIRI